MTPLSLSVAPDDTWFWENEPCRAACPVHTDAGAYVVAIAEGRLEEAYTIARRSNPFASICGRVCAAPCEAACRRGAIDAPVSIRALKRYATDAFGVESFHAGEHWHQAHGPVPKVTTGSVGVIGGGPAGLAAAHDLRLAGHAVTVYEAQPLLGGMMVMGIPEYRLPRELIAREVRAVTELGVEVRTGFRVGVEATLAELLERHDALFLAVGTGRGRDLGLPGRELDGVFLAIEFLLNVNRGYQVDLGRRVVVVGGGNVAFDAARTALRNVGEPGVGEGPRRDSESRRVAMATTLDVARAARREGVEDITVVALESAEEIPADTEEIAAAEAEGIRIVHRRAPHRFVGDGRIRALETLAVERVFDEQGRFAPVMVPSSEELIDADTVILAVGQAADLDVLGGIELERSPQGVQVDPGSLRTSHERIWAGGDIARGPRNLIDAIADGQRAARSIHGALTGEPLPVPSVQVELRTRRGFRRLSTGYDAIGRVPVPAMPTSRRVGFAEVEVGYDDEQARLEGLRCLRCFDNVMLDASLCILCGLCVDVCPTDVITIARADDIRVGTANQSVLLLDEDRCIRCGLCVNRCPPGALSMVHAREVPGD